MPSLCRVVLSKTGDALVEVLLSILELPFWWTHTHGTHVFSPVYTPPGHLHHASTLQTHTLGQAQLQCKETRGLGGCGGAPRGWQEGELASLGARRLLG